MCLLMMSKEEARYHIASRLGNNISNNNYMYVSNNGNNNGNNNVSYSSSRNGIGNYGDPNNLGINIVGGTIPGIYR